MMSPEAAITALDLTDPDDPESAHSRADDVLLEVVPPEVAEAYRRLVRRCGWWATA